MRRSTQTVAIQVKVSRRKLRLPALPRSDGGGVVEETVFFFLLGQLGEFGVEWVIGWEEGLFAMQDWRVGAGLVFEAIDLAGAEREFDATEQGGVGVGFEVGVGEVGEFSGMAMELDRIRVRHASGCWPGPALPDGIGCPEGFNERFHI